VGWAKAGVREAELIGKEYSPKLIEVHPKCKLGDWQTTSIQVPVGTNAGRHGETHGLIVK